MRCEITYIDRNTWRRINSIGKALQCNTVIKYHCYQKCPFPFSANKENIFSWKVNFQFWMTIDESNLWQRTKKNFQHSSLQSWRHSRYSTQSERDKKVRKVKIIQFKVVTLINPSLVVYEKVGGLIWKKSAEIRPQDSGQRQKCLHLINKLNTTLIN